MRSPDWVVVACQAKGSGRQAGSVKEVLIGIEKAKDQLRLERPTLITVHPQTAEHLPIHPRELIVALVGPTIGEDGIVTLRRESLGVFFTPDWSHVGGVLLLDFIRAAERCEQTYACTVLLNPCARAACRCDPSWFPFARVLWWDGHAFQWQNGEAARGSIPSGTSII